MKGSTKGFTLVELLAVIVILAIIALITVPAILNLINDAREKAAEDKAWGTIDAVRLAFVRSQGGLGETKNSSNVINTNKIEVCFGNSKTENCDDSVDGEQVVVSGDKPIQGSVTIETKSGKMSCNGLVFTNNGTYICNTGDGNTMTCEPAMCNEQGENCESTNKNSNANSGSGEG